MTKIECPRPGDLKEWQEAATSPLRMLQILSEHYGMRGLDGQKITPYPHVVELDRYIEALCKGRLYASGPGPFPRIKASYLNADTGAVISGTHRDWYDQKLNDRMIPDGYFLSEFSAEHPTTREPVVTKCGVGYPTRFGKSFMCSLATPAWYVLMNPVTRVLVGGHTARFAESELGARMARFVRAYGPKMGRPVARDPSMSTVEFADTSSIFFFGIDTGVIGRTKRLGILDDPVKNFQEAKSVEYRAKQARFYTGEWSMRDTHVPGLPPPCELMALSRIHPEDLAGLFVFDREDATKPRDGWSVLHLAALIEDENGVERSSCESMRRTKELQKFRADDPYTFQSQCQNDPKPLDGAGFPAPEDWPRFEVANDGHSLVLDRGPYAGVPLEPDDRFITMDFAGTAHHRSDYTAVAVWDYHRESKQVFCRHVARARVEVVDHLGWIKEQIEPWHRASPIHHGTVENSGVSLYMLQTAGRDSSFLGFPVWECNRSTTGPKAMRKNRRFELYAYAVNEGRFALPADNPPWHQAWMNEHVLWPNTTYDDQIDVGCDALLETTRLGAPLRTAPARPPFGRFHDEQEATEAWMRRVGKRKPTGAEVLG